MSIVQKFNKKSTHIDFLFVFFYISDGRFIFLVEIDHLSLINLKKKKHYNENFQKSISTSNSFLKLLPPILGKSKQ